MLKVFLCAAFLMGLGGPFTSSGQVYMANQVQSWPGGYLGKAFAWDEWQQAGTWLNRPQCQQKVVVGYSNGGSTASWLANLKFKVDTVISLDATIWLPRVPLGANVSRAIVFHDTNLFSSFPPVGHAVLTKGPGWRGVFITYTIQDFHAYVDKNPVNQAKVFSEIKRAKK